MLFAKNTLSGLSLLWLTGCSAVSPGHLPFCARASTSVPGAPASSFATGSQVLVLNPGVEICAPVWVATALLATFQPPEPRLEMSLAPVSAGELRLTPDARAGMARWLTLAAEPACADAPDTAKAAATTAAQTTKLARLTCLIADSSWPATPAPR